MKSLSGFERALIGAGGSGIAGAFTYVCMHPLDTVKTKSQTKDASQIIKIQLMLWSRPFVRVGFWGFIVVGLLLLWVLLHPQLCILANQFCQNFEKYPPVMIPPTAGAMGIIVSSAITVP